MRFQLDRVRGHALFPDEVEKDVPELYSCESLSDEKIMVRVKFFALMSDWYWYVTEYSPEQKLCFGLVKGFETEPGYFSLDELGNLNKNGLPLIERDCCFKPVTLSELKQKLNFT